MSRDYLAEKICAFCGGPIPEFADSHGSIDPWFGESGLPYCSQDCAMVCNDDQDE